MHEETFSHDFLWQSRTYFESRFLFDSDIGFQLCEDYRSQPQDKGTMIEHRRNAIRAQSCAEYNSQDTDFESPVLLQWFKRLANPYFQSRSPQESVQRNKSRARRDFDLCCAREEIWTRLGGADRYPRDTTHSKTCFHVRGIRLYSSVIFISAWISTFRDYFLFHFVFQSNVRSRITIVARINNVDYDNLKDPRQEIVIDNQLFRIGSLRPSVSRPLHELFHSYTSDPLTHSHAVRSDNSMNYDRLYTSTPWVAPYISGQASFLFQIVYWKIWCVHVEHDEGLSEKGHAAGT